MFARRYTVLVADRSSGVVRRLTIRLGVVVASVTSVLMLPVLIGLGAKWSAQTQIDHQNQRIDDEQSRIDALTKDLTGRMAAADALIASLEQQVTYFTTLFGSMNGTSNK